MPNIPQEEAVNNDEINEEYSREDKKFRDEFPIKNYNKNIIEEWFIKINYIPEEEKCKAIKRIQTRIHSEVIKDNLIILIKSLKLNIGTMGTSVITFANIKEGEIICKYPGRIRSRRKALKYIKKMNLTIL